MIRRASIEDVEAINEWFWRDSGKRGDFSQFFDDQMSVCLIAGEGGAMFVWRGPGIFEVHVFFEQRGKEVLRISREMLKIMREQHGGKLFWAAVPVESRHVIMFTRLMGWKSQGVACLSHGYCELFTGGINAHRQ
jgi:hypothetical protein